MFRILSAAAGAGVILAALAVAPKGQPPAAEGPRVPVIVELFTSEGCSSCPPADDVLTELASKQPIAGARVIALGEHVDYWDSLGWRDPFSDAAFTRRQSNYDTTVFGSDQIYTPQMIVNGRQEFVGSSMPAAKRAIAEAVADRSAHVEVTLTPAAAKGVHIAVAAPPGSMPGAEVVLAVTEDGLVTKVARGENRGRTLQHTAVVRRLTPVATIEPGAAAWSRDVAVPLDSAWRPAALQVVAFVQDRRTRRILGAAAIPLQKRDLSLSSTFRYGGRDSRR